MARCMARKPTIVQDLPIQPMFIENKMQSLMFSPLQANGSNFLKWTHDAKTVLSADDLARTLII